MAYSFLDLAAEVLNSASGPLTYERCWEEAQAKGLTTKVTTKGKTPWQTMGAQLYVDVRDNAESRFIKVGKRPTLFFLKSRESELSEERLRKIEIDETKRPAPETPYHERDLHPLLTYYVYANPTFSRGRSVFTKTIFHESSRRKGYNEWLHPDIVGVYLPLEDWNPVVIEFNQLLDNNSIRLFSFELKKSVGRGNYRESFFQAVSNSSWAHEGYLVAAEINRTMISWPNLDACPNRSASVSSIFAFQISIRRQYFSPLDDATFSTGKHLINSATRTLTSKSSFKTLRSTLNRGEYTDLNMIQS